MNGAHALFKALTDAGFGTCFANSYPSEMQLVYKMARNLTSTAQSSGSSFTGSST